jgi:hypothetical protein
MPTCVYCNKPYANVNLHITKSHSYSIHYSNFTEGSKVKLYFGGTQLGDETQWTIGNTDEWVECWFTDSTTDNAYWLQCNRSSGKLNQRDFYITLNNGVPDKEEKQVYCKFIKI